jgi:alpha-D-ribose 1-methylphosphonate 5-triphosphate synthase subunit PhnG
MLTREQRFEAIAVADPAALVPAANALLAAHPVEVLRPPVGGSVMIRAIETAEGSPFNLGEVSVTEAEVELAGQRGYAMVMGFAPEHALAGAIIDAAMEARIDQAPALEALLIASIDSAAREQAAGWETLAPTLVTFDEINDRPAHTFHRRRTREQAVYRAALQALARPGGSTSCPVCAISPRGGSLRVRALAALADHEVSIAVTGATEAETAFASLGTGARLTAASEAGYVLALEDDPSFPGTQTRRP